MSKINRLSSDNPSEILSATIDLLRFPLVILVIFIHMNPQVVNLIDADYSLFSGRGIYNLAAILGSHVLSHIAVPTFYLISGFLFFYNIDQWSWSIYRRKIKSRIRTLFIPYVLWNLLPFLLLLLSMLCGVVFKGESTEEAVWLIKENNWHIFWDCNEWGAGVNWLGKLLRMTGPYDLPLWYLRDLIVVSLLSPVIYLCVRNFKLYFVFFLFLAYLSRIWIPAPGFGITAFFYFSVGAYFALNRLDIVSFAHRYRFIIVPFSAVLLIITTIYDGTGTVIGSNVYPLFACSGVFTAFIIGSCCVRKWGVRPNKRLVSSCFFVYAFHAVRIPVSGSPLEFVDRIVHSLIPGTSGIEEGLCYVVVPFITALISIAVLMIAKKTFPKLTLLFSGNK